MTDGSESISRRQLLRSAIGGLAGAIAAPYVVPLVASAATQSTAELLSNASDIVRRIAPPVIPPRSLTVSLDSTTDARIVRARIQESIEEAVALGGGKVVIPPGTWPVAGPLRLASNIELHLSAGATLRFSNDPQDYLPAVLTRWEGTEMFGYSPFIYAYHATNVAITGSGTLDGNSASYLSEWRRDEGADRRQLREMGRALTPITERIFAQGHSLRPSFIQFLGCSSILVENIRVKDFPFWGVHLLYSQDITVRSISIDSDNNNNDGIDVDSCRYVRIEHCTFRTKDDCVAIKSGRDADGRRVGRPSEDVVVRDCHMIRGGSSGIAIGSEMSGGVRNVYVLRCLMDKVDSALNVKTNLDRGGKVEKICMWNVAIGRCSRVVRVTTDYHSYSGGNFVPTICDISLDDIRCERAEIALDFVGVEAIPIRNVTLRKVQVRYADRALNAQHVKGLLLRDVAVNRIAVAEPVETL